MKTTSPRTNLLFAVSVAVAGLANGSDVHAQNSRTIDFGRDIQPILARQCYSCHGPGVQEAGLKLNDRKAVEAKLESGAVAVVPGDPNASELLKRIASTDDNERMPPKGKPLSATQVELIKRWISEGAEWNEHWAFRPLKTPKPPKNIAKPDLDPIDAFLKAKRIKAGIIFENFEADALTLIRRATYDLTGLAPTPEEINAYLKDDPDKAYENLIDRLLASDHYGERWGRHWLDLVRFAESNSYERDGVKPNAWKYRDYVIRSFNADKPYDQFVREQIAGDELPDRTAETIIASGFLRLGVWQDEPVDAKQSYYDAMDDVVRTISQAFLGLTINCARCHDHKIDPIRQADYYKLVAFLHDLTPYATRGDERTNSQTDISSPDVNSAHADYDRQKRELLDQMRPIEQRGIVKMSAEDQRKTEGREREKVLNEKLLATLDDGDKQQYADLKKKLEELLKKQLPGRESAMSVARRVVPPPETFIFIRGNAGSPGEKVEPGFPGLFESPDPKLPAIEKGSAFAGRRTVLADWIVSPENRLTSRVIANRIWQFHFGRGLVRSSNNFGLLGESPTHPQLLEWLANEFVKGGWKMKPLHKRIMMTEAYRMSSRANQTAMEKDPRNDNFWRFDMRRLSAEEIRDSMYQVAGTFNPKMYGPGVYSEISEEVLAGQSVPGQNWGRSSPEEQARRAVYIHVKRSLLTPMLSAFDFPDPDASCEARFNTTQPAQALALFNGKFVRDRAAELAERLRKEAGPKVANQVELSLRLATSRHPSDDDINRGVQLIETLRTKHKLDERKALEMYCLTVLNLNEFVFLD